jgi:hypothetical protein
MAKTLPSLPLPLNLKSREEKKNKQTLRYSLSFVPQTQNPTNNLNQ